MTSVPADMVPSRRTPRPLRGPFSRWPRSADAALVVAVLVAQVGANLAFEAAEETPALVVRGVGENPILAYLLILVASLALYWRRTHAPAVVAVTLGAVAVWAGPTDPLPALLVALYSLGRYVADGRIAYAGLGLALAVTGLGDAVDGEPFVAVVAFMGVAALPWYIGRRVRIRGEYVKLLQERAASLERERAAESQRAVAEERTRIARELHDVVAHRVSMMTVQAGAARTVASDDPDAAYRAMEAVELAGRQALGELRHLLGVLRPGPTVDELGVQPGVAEIPRLVEQLADAGIEIALTSDGAAELPARVSLSAYRIVQEALTNVLKHGGPEPTADVSLSRDNGVLTIEVEDRGSGATVLPGAGHGIVGMRERALLLGGTLDAGPRLGGGFRVVARLPIEDDS